MERTGTPFGILLHGGDLLILQHQVHQSAIKRKTAAALLSSAAVLVANSEWTRDLLSHAPERARHRRHARPGAGRAARRRPRVLPSGSRHPRGPRPLRPRRGALAPLGRPPHAGTRASTRRSRRSRGSGRATPISGTRWSARGEEHEALEAEARELGVADRVRFLTDVPDRDLPALYNTAEVYLGVSRLMEQRVEGFGISLAEASACGVPVIAGRSGGIPAAVRDGETGLLVDAERAEAVAEALAGLLDDAALRARLGAAGRRAVESHYNWDRVTRDLAPHRSRAGRGRQAGRGLMPLGTRRRGHRGVRPPVPGLGRAAGPARARSRLAPDPPALASPGAAPPLLPRGEARARLRLHGRDLHAPAPAARRRGGGIRHLARGDRPGQAIPRVRPPGRCSPPCRPGRASSTGSTATKCWSTSRTTRG